MLVTGRPEPVALLDTIKALVAALMAAGWITVPQARVVVLGAGLLITVALTVYTRAKVTPVDDPVGPTGDPLTLPDGSGWEGQLGVDDTDLTAPAAAPSLVPPPPVPPPPVGPTSPPVRLLAAPSMPSGWNGYPVPQVPPPVIRGRGRHAAADPNDAITPQDWVR